MEGSVVPAFAMHYWGEDKAECDIVECKVKLTKDEHPFGEVSGGHLQIRGLLKKVEWDPVEGKMFSLAETESTSEPVASANLGRGHGSDSLGLVFPDSTDDRGRGVCDVWALPLRSSTSTAEALEGMIVVPVDGTTSFCRVGMFQIPLRKRGKLAEMQRWMSGNRQVVNIL